MTSHQHAQMQHQGNQILTIKHCLQWRDSRKRQYPEQYKKNYWEKINKFYKEIKIFEEIQSLWIADEIRIALASSYSHK